MPKVIILLLILSTFHVNTLESTTLQCDYNLSSWNLIQRSYTCYVQNLLNISTIDFALVDQITGTHLDSKADIDVTGLKISNKLVHYFPQEIDKIFSELKAIEISNSKLKIIHQTNLEPFPKLVELYLNDNQLEVIEKGLFDFNLELALINLKNNKISFIDSEVFNNLVKLSILSLESNVCIDKKAENDLISVKNIIKASNDQCNDPSYLKLMLNFQNIEIKSKTLNVKNFKEKLEILLNEIKNSNFVNFFEHKLQNLQAEYVKRSLEEVATASIITSTIPQLATTKVPLKNENFQIYSTPQSSNDSNATNFDKNLQTCPSFNETLSGVKNSIKNAVMRCTENFAGVHSKFTSLNETILDLYKATTDIKKVNVDVVTKLQTFEENLINLRTLTSKKLEQIESKVDATHNSLVKDEINKFEEKIEKRFNEIEEKLLEIVKALKING